MSPAYGPFYEPRSPLGLVRTRRVLGPSRRASTAPRPPQAERSLTGTAHAVAKYAPRVHPAAAAVPRRALEARAPESAMEVDDGVTRPEPDDAAARQFLRKAWVAAAVEARLEEFADVRDVDVVCATWNANGKDVTKMGADAASKSLRRARRRWRRAVVGRRGLGVCVAAPLSSRERARSCGEGAGPIASSSKLGRFGAGVDLEPWLKCREDPADIYAVGAQEMVDLTVTNVVVTEAKSSRRADAWRGDRAERRRSFSMPGRVAATPRPVDVDI